MSAGAFPGESSLIIVFSDYTKKLHCLKIQNRNYVELIPEKTIQINGKHDDCRFWKLDGINMCYMIREIELNSNYRQLLLENFAPLNVHMLWFQMIPPSRQIIDYKWNHMISQKIWEKIEVEYLMSWLSTLGGGFSALGEQFTKFAETAGKISLKQLSIGIQLGDPFLQARCKLYLSISLIQTGKLRAAKYIVREQYNFAIQHKETDKRLINMCKGIWLRLQYEYRLRAQTRLQQLNESQKIVR